MNNKNDFDGTIEELDQTLNEMAMLDGRDDSSSSDIDTTDDINTSDKDSNESEQNVDTADNIIDGDVSENSPEAQSNAENETVPSESSANNGEQGENGGNKNSILPLEQTLPNELFIVPLQGRPIFPGIFTPLMINASEDTKIIEKAYKGNGFIGLSLIQKDAEHPTAEDLYEIGTVARIIKKINLPEGGLNVFISTIKRFKIKKVLSSENPISVAVEYLNDEEEDTLEVKALTRALLSEMKELSENNPLFSEEMRLNMVNIDHNGKIADFIASILTIDKTDQQKVLEMLNVRQRMEKVLVYIKKEQELLHIQKKIQNELNEKVEKNQREYFLREELKSIQEELGGDDANASDYQKFKIKIDSLKFEGEVKETVESELEKFHLMDPNSAEYIGTRNYLELVAALPWKDNKIEDYDLDAAKAVLDHDHYGLEDVKKRIIEYLAVRKLKKDNKGSILLLVGPPGVGKTSVGHSIAKAMNKHFYRFSVGGMRDEAEIKGHRRTYIGAMPGKILSGMKITKSKSPVFMIDEIDKMGTSYQGDPASALLEVLDPEQNVAFRDNYLDLPFDISEIFFILTANTLDSIPRPLLDRAEIIELSGYIDQEKIEIAKKYLIPKNLKKNGLLKKQVKFTKAALVKIAEEYAREAGVRNFEKSLDKIDRKIVTEIMLEAEKNSAVNDSKKSPTKENKEETVSVEGTVKTDIKTAVKEVSRTIDAADLYKYLGQPIFDEDTIKKAEVPGTAIGLAWTSMGGDTLLLESIVFPGKQPLQLTGQMGDVMKESAEIAMNWVKQQVLSNGVKTPEWFEHNTIHLHIPEGATPKDGPSAGITMATTFMSLFTGKVIKSNLAMTGELSLTGKVLPIGGLREKTVAAKRNGIKTIIIPKGNVRDLEKIPEHVKAGIKFVPVSKAEEVMKFVFK